MITESTDKHFMTEAQVNKLNGLTNYVHPNTHSAAMITESSNKHFMTDDQVTKLNGLTNYTHPSTHPATMIVESTDKHFITDAQSDRVSKSLISILGTYEEIKALVLSNSLLPESKYTITDYRTMHVIPNSSPIEINTGIIEPLTLVAASVNTFHATALSSLFPTDIIHYRFDDDSCEDGTRDPINKK